MCQIQDALAVLIPCWWHNQPVSEEVIDRLVKRIAYLQKRNGTARVSHTKTTLRRLRDLDISLTEIERCYWGPNLAL